MNPENIHYSITLSHPEAHLYTISCRVEQPDTSGQQFQLPNWIPGSYMIRDFAKNIIRFVAKDKQGNLLTTTKINKSQWQVEACMTAILIEYDVYAWDLSVRSAHLDTTHGFFNGTSVFLAVIGQEQSPCTITINKPSEENYKDWRVATSLHTLESNLYMFGEYRAENYDDLIDHPVEMGTFDLTSFYINGIQHDIVLTGKHRADMDKLRNDLEVICQTHVDFFGELPDIKRYIFLTMVVGDGYGGLEHRSSTSLLCSRKDLPIKGQEQTNEYRNFLGLCSHEYFHTWNVKRIKPEAYLPYNLNEEVYTEQLWAFEGITSYYDELALVRSKLITEEHYLEMLGKTITRVLRGAGRFKQSVAESSFDTWTRFYKQDEGAPNNIVSYYTKGSLIALALDFEIRKATENKKSLDDVMHHLWSNYGKKKIGVPEKQIEKIASDIANKDFNHFFEQYLYNTKEIPLKEYFSFVGINLESYTAPSVDDTGGKKPAEESNKDITNLGARIINHSLGAKLSHIYDDGNAQKAGLAAGDIIIAIDNLKTSKADLEKTLTTYNVGSEVLLHAFRRDELMLFKLILTSSSHNSYYLTLENDKIPGWMTNNNNN